MGAVSAPGNGSRKSILELAPLECECMNALWLLGEGTVLEIRDQLAPTLPRAYTTIMTIMGRLARKGAVTRSKKGKAYLYRPNITAEQARARAISHLVESYFGGSRQALMTHLDGGVAREAIVATVDARIDDTLL